MGVDAFSKSALINGKWNKMFDREQSVPLIETILGIEFDIELKQ